MARGHASLNEVLGEHGEDFSRRGVTLQDLPKLLGDLMPKMQFNALGRVHLTRALRARFGEGYRAIPGVGQALTEFDSEAQKELNFHKIKSVYGRK